MGCTRRHCCAWSSLVFGLIFVAAAFVTRPLLERVMREQIESQLVTDSESAELYDLWKDPKDVPMFMTYYVYDVKNPEEVESGGKPFVEVLGPFTYAESRVKWNISFTEDRTMVNYFVNRTFKFVDVPCPEGPVAPDYRCSLNENMTITTGNIALTGIMAQVADIAKNHIEHDLIDLFLDLVAEVFNLLYENEERLFIRRPVREVIFGYNDPIVEKFVDRIEEILDKRFHLHINLTSPLVQIQKNNDPEEWQHHSRVFTGRGRLQDLFSFQQWAGHNVSIGVWKGCPEKKQFNAMGNRINGTEGINFQPLLKRNTPLQVYTEDLLRSADIVHTSDEHVRGVQTYKYTIADYMLKNASDYPMNCAFSGYGPSGVLNMTDTTGAPVFASKPGFLDADPYYRGLVDGLPEVNRDLQDTYLCVEPWTGGVFLAHQRLQINLRVVPAPVFETYRHVRKEGFYLPICFADEHAEITPKLVDEFNAKVGMAIKLREYAPPALWALGAFLVLVALLLFHPRKTDRTGVYETTPLLADSHSAEVGAQPSGSIYPNIQ